MNFEKYVILSLAGSHAKESFNEIIQRKIKDIENVGYTFWLENSPQTKPDIVQDFYKLANKERIDLNCLLYESSNKGKGAKDTKNDTKAKEYSVDKKNWLDIDSKLSPITGKMSANSHALMFDKLEHVKNLKLNLENYLDFKKQEPIRNNQNASTFCAIKKYDKNEAKNPNNVREIFAIGRIHNSSSVWLR